MSNLGMYCLVSKYLEIFPDILLFISSLFILLRDCNVFFYSFKIYQDLF